MQMRIITNRWRVGGCFLFAFGALSLGVLQAQDDGTIIATSEEPVVVIDSYEAALDGNGKSDLKIGEAVEPDFFNDIVDRIRGIFTNDDGSIEIGFLSGVFKSDTPALTIDAEGDAIFRGDLTARTIKSAGDLTVGSPEEPSKTEGKAITVGDKDRGVIELHGGDGQDITSKGIVQTGDFGMEVGTLTNQVLKFFTNSTPRMSITTEGNVGIGIPSTTNPTARLEVGGDIKATDTITASSFIGDGSQLTGIEGKFVDGDTSTDAVFTTGNVGIGTTSPSTKLDVDGSVTASSFIGDGSQLTGIEGKFVDGTSVTDAVFTTGNVGIGTTDPKVTFEIAGDTPYMRMKSKSNSETSIGFTNSSDWVVSGIGHDFYSGKLFFAQGGGASLSNTKMVIDSAGNVGIGTTSPGAKLHVDNHRLDITTSTTSGGGQNRFNGLVDEGRRGQLVLSSSYSDLVIASSQANNSHGSTLTFATYNPSDATDYKKWVVNQGNWGSRKQFLDFGYSDTAGRTNPHSNINTTDTVLTLDGINKRVGIGTTSPGAKLEVNGGEYWNHISGYNKTFSQAKSACESQGKRLAHYSEVLDAYNNGKQWCSWGWVSEGFVAYPMQDGASSGCGGSTGGVRVSYPSTSSLYGATCASDVVRIQGSQMNTGSVTAASLKVNGGNGDGEILLVADEDNSGEDDHPKLKFSQDGGGVTGYVGYETEGNQNNNLFISNEWNDASGDVRFRTRNTTRMTVDGNGNVGIGTSSPSSKLDVRGNVGTSGHLTVGEGGYNKTIKVRHINGKDHDSDDNSALYLNYNTGQSVVVGKNDKYSNLVVYGNTTSNSFLYSSDQNKKKDIQTLSNPLETIQNLRGVSFHWKESNEKSIGFIAQEVEKVLPSLVSGEAGEKSVAYGNLTAVLVEAVKELSAEKDAEIALLRQEISDLKADNQQLWESLESLTD